MRKLYLLLVFVFIIIPYPVYAILNLELTRGIASGIPIAIVPFALQADSLPPQDVSAIITNDIKNSGRFKIQNNDSLKKDMADGTEAIFKYFRSTGTDYVVIGKVQSVGQDRYAVSMQLSNVFQGSGKENNKNQSQRPLLSKQFTVPGNQLRALAHHLSDLIYAQITGTPGIFSTKLAYIVTLRPMHTNPNTQYILEVSDQDGYNPQALLISTDPIMSPAWSPDGKQLAYVSFEKRHASIYSQDVTTGARRLISAFPGINGAPAWSPDGKQLALVLSKSGAPNIYTMDIGTGRLTQLTNDFNINTEPVWSPDGKLLLFTSNRGGGPQIYQINLAKRNEITRVTYDGDYNARASFVGDGQRIVLIHRVSGIYNIALLDLNSGTMRVLTGAKNDSASPSVAPNGSLVLYDTVEGNQNVLAMVSIDGGIELRLPARSGEAQDPAWSPFQV